MSVYSKLMLAALAALATVAFAVGTASANRIAIDDQDIDVIWEDATQRLTFNAAGNLTSCEVTLLGSFHSQTIAKVPNQLIGHITHVRVDTPGCAGGSGIALQNTLPWHITYRSFSGRLPTIERIAINLIRASFEIQVGTIRCLAATTAAEPGIGTGAIDAVTGQITGLTSSGTIDINDVAPSTLCDAIDNGSFNPTTGSVRDLDNALVFIRLV